MSCWWDWSFSEGFGNRIYVNILPILAIPLAVFFASLQRRWLKVAAGVVAGVLVAVTVLLMVSYWRGRLPGNGIGWEGYLRLLRHP